MMTNSNFSLQNTLEANYLNIQLNEPVRLDEIAINVIAEDCPEFIIPFRVVNINNNVSLKYKLINTIALEYASLTMDKKTFVKMYLNLLTPFVKGNDWFLDYHNFCVDPRYVYLDKEYEQVFYIYVPEYSYVNEESDILEFFRKTFHRVDISDDKVFQVKLFQYFARDLVTLSELYQMFLEESKSVSASSTLVNVSTNDVPAATPVTSESVPTVSQNPVQETTKAEEQSVAEEPTTKGIGFGLFGNKKEKTASKGFVEDETPASASLGDDSSDEVMEALFGSGKKKIKEKTTSASESEKKKSGISLFGKKKEEVSQEQAATVNTTSTTSSGSAAYSLSGMSAFSVPTGVQAGSDKTEVFVDDIVVSGAFLELIDSPIPGAMARIDLNFTKDFVVVGRTSSDPVQPDIAFSRDFTRIGRQHARIEKRDGAYYVIDLGSQNHTLLNGQQLVPNTPYPLNDGGELTFTESKPVRYRIHLS